MLLISEDNKSILKSIKYKVYSKEPITEGVECFSSSKEFGSECKFYITSVELRNIKNVNGRFFFTNEDLSTTADWFPAQVIDVGTNFVPCKKRKSYVSKINKRIGKRISSDKCIVDVGKLGSFNGVNEDVSTSEYRFYLTLFNDYTVKQCKYDRHDLYDAIFNASKYDLPSKLQNSNFLKPKDFTVINVRRKDEESVPVGLIIKEDNGRDYSNEYGTVYINMDNCVSIKWNWLN